MSNGSFSTPSNGLSRSVFSASRSTTTKRDSLMAELERDPQHSSAKRQQRSQAFTSHMAHASLERQLVAAQTAKVELDIKLKEKDIIIERLERDRRWLAEREKEEREEKERERAEREEEKNKADKDLRALRSSLSALREQYTDLQDSHSALSRSTAQTITTQKSQLTTLTRQNTLLEDELVEFKRIAEERSVTIEDLQQQLEQVDSVQESHSRRDVEDENWSVVRQELHRQASYLRQLESVNAKQNAELTVLRERYNNVEVLKEEKRNLERQIVVMDQLREKVVRLEAEVESARQERQEWATNTDLIASPSQTPVSVTQSLSNLRLTHARLLEDHGANMALLRQREAELEKAEQRNKEALDDVAMLAAKIRTLKDKLTRREHQTLLAEREVGFLQALLASYSAEDIARDTTHVDEVSAQRIHHLEDLLVEYKSINTALQQAFDEQGDDADVARGRTRKELLSEVEKARACEEDTQKALEKAQDLLAKEVDKVDKLEQTLFELRGEIVTGSHIPPRQRILKLKDDPDQQWLDLRKEMMDRLKHENESLTRRLRQLEQSGAAGTASESSGEHREGRERDALVPRESVEVAQKEKQELEEIIKQKEKRLLRLQQVFTAKSAEFRETIASILGLKLAFYQNGHVRVTSIYDLTASFVFQPTDGQDGGVGAKMQLVAQGEGGPQDLPQLMRNWVEEEQCIPGFLASVTLECYDKMKRESQGDS